MTQSFMRTMATTATLLLLPTLATAADAAKDAALDRFMAVSNADGEYQVIVNQAQQGFAPLVLANRAKQKEVVAIIESELVPVLKANQPVFLKALRSSYDKRFTTSELNQLADFMASTVWLKLNHEQAEILPEAAKSLGALQTSLNTKVGPAVLAKMRAAGLAVPVPAASKSTTKR